MELISLCTGYGGLDQAVVSHLGKKGMEVTISAFAEVDPAAAAVFSHHHPNVPNLGDVKLIDWSDHHAHIVTAGYPCQPFSVAGRQRGTDDPRHLWPDVLRAVRELRPDLFIFENVANHLRLGFPEVLADLAEVGFDVRWRTIRASDAGAPHQRNRLYGVARPSHSTISGLEG